MAVEDAFSAFETLLLEKLDTAVVNLTLKTDDVANQLINTFPAVDRAGRATGSEDATAELEARWPIQVQEGGMISGGDMGVPSISTMGADAVLNMETGLDSAYLDPTKTPDDSFIEAKMLLKNFKLSLTHNKTKLLAMLAANKVDVLALSAVEKAVRLVRELDANGFWSAGYGVMGVINETSPAVDEGASRAWLTVDGGTVLRFRKGFRYVFASDVSGVPTTARAGKINSPGVVRCTGIDIDLGKVQFESEAGEGPISGLVNNDLIVQHGLYNFSGTADRSVLGIERLLINSGNYPGTSLAVTDHVELKSFIEDNRSSGAPTVEPEPWRIGKMVTKIAKSNLMPPSTLIAEPSLWDRFALLQQQAHASYQVPQGGTFMASGGVSGPNVTWGNNSFARLSSGKCRPETIFAIDPTTFMRFLPLGSAVHWLMSNGGISGTESIYRLVTNGAQATPLFVADGDYFVQFGQKEPRRAFIQYGIYTQDNQPS